MTIIEGKDAQDKGIKKDSMGTSDAEMPNGRTLKALASGAGLFPGISEHIYSRTDFEAVRDIVYRLVGIVLPPGKATLVYSRLAPLVRESGEQTFGRYVALMHRDEAVLRRAINALTTNHTFFYREMHHFEHLIAHVRPALIHKARMGEEVRIWSAGCSTGEELYSLTLALLGESRKEAQALLQGDVAILASDIADQAVAGAKAAVYPLESLKDVPERLVRNWVDIAGDQAVMKDDVRSLIRVRRLNLLDNWPIRRKFDVIFCRNVMIYFDQPTRERLVGRFADHLLPGGHLYIGHSERVSGPAQNVMTLVGNTVYQKVGG